MPGIEQKSYITSGSIITENLSVRGYAYRPRTGMWFNEVSLETKIPHIREPKNILEFLGFWYQFSGKCGLKGYRRNKPELRPGMSNIGYLCGDRIYAFFPGAPVEYVSVAIELPLLEELLEGIPGCVPDFLSGILDHRFSSNTLFDVNPISNQMLTIIDQIRSCKLTEPLKKIYIESKILESVYTRIQQFIEQHGSSPFSKLSLKSNEVRKLKNAKDFLIENFVTPPSIYELSKIIGINDYKLKKGFKELFGTTVFGFIRQERLNLSRELLESGDKTITEISLEIGYSNPSHFAAAFKKQYGVNPSNFRQIH